MGIIFIDWKFNIKFCNSIFFNYFECTNETELLQKTMQLRIGESIINDNDNSYSNTKGFIAADRLQASEDNQRIEYNPESNFSVNLINKKGKILDEKVDNSELQENY